MQSVRRCKLGRIALAVSVYCCSNSDVRIQTAFRCHPFPLIENKSASSSLILTLGRAASVAWRETVHHRRTRHRRGDTPTRASQNTLFIRNGRKKNIWGVGELERRLSALRGSYAHEGTLDLYGP